MKVYPLTRGPSPVIRPTRSVAQNSTHNTRPGALELRAARQRSLFARSMRGAAAAEAVRRRHTLFALCPLLSIAILGLAQPTLALAQISDLTVGMFNDAMNQSRAFFGENEANAAATALRQRGQNFNRQISEARANFWKEYPDGAGLKAARGPFLRSAPDQGPLLHRRWRGLRVGAT